MPKKRRKTSAKTEYVKKNRLSQQAEIKPMRTRQAKEYASAITKFHPESSKQTKRDAMKQRSAKRSKEKQAQINTSVDNDK